MQELFYVSHDGQELGPFSVDEIVTKIKGEELWGVDYVYVESEEDWVVINEYPLFAEKLKGHVDTASTPPPIETENAADFTAPQSAAQPEPVETTVVHASGAKASVEMKEDTVVDLEMKTSVTQLSAIEVAPEVKPEKKKEISTEKVEIKAESKAEHKPENKVENKAESKVESKNTAVAEKKSSDKAQPSAVALGNLIKIVDGVGTIDVTHFVAETVRLTLLDESKLGIEVPQSNELQVRPGQAKKVVISGPQETEAGQSATLRLEALDSFGNLDSGFKGQITVSVSGSAKGGGKVQLQNGKAEFSITDKVAEKVTLHLSDSDNTGLDLSVKHQLDVVAGPAKQFVIVAPRETMAGQPVTVMVKALDAYGNLATNTHGSVKLNVEGTPYERVNESGPTGSASNESGKNKVRGLS